MKQFLFQIVILLIVIFAGLYLTSNPNYFGGLLPGGQTAQVSLPSQLRIIDSSSGQQKTLVNIEIADTADKRRLGLGGRESLASDSGMLFVFDTLGTQTFWMKGMKFPLDMIWISGDTVVDLTKNAPIAPAGTPDSELQKYSPKVNVDKVLEVNGGFADKFNVKEGDKLQAIQPSPSPVQ